MVKVVRMSRGKPMVVFTIYMAQEDYEKLREYAKKINIGTSTLARAILLNVLKSKEIEEYVASRKRTWPDIK